MEKGDLGTWVEHRSIVVLEGVLALIPEPAVHREGFLRRDKTVEYPPADDWGWSIRAIKEINDQASRFNRLFDGVTFLSSDVADMAVEWLGKYDVRISGVEYSNFDVFCSSLTWRPDVHTVVDVDPERLDRYGIKGYATQWGGAF
jgi:hypothetical protein